MKARKFLIAFALVAMAGCQTKPPPDPNDPEEVGMVDPEVLMRNLKWASDAANMRVEKGEINERQASDLVARSAYELTKHIDLSQIRVDQAWDYAEVFRTARIWDKAKIVYKAALIDPKAEDRRVNGNLRLAQILGELGEVEEAIKRASSVLDAPPRERAPIMPALTLEVVPACQRQGYDKELADLLEKAIPIYEGTIVDETTRAGQDFLMARPYHIRRAKEQIEILRRRASRGIRVPGLRMPRF